MRRSGLALAVLLAAGPLGRAAPPRYFELEVPEFQQTPFEGDVVEVPLSSVSKLIITILPPLADDVPYGRIYPRLNGDSVSIICQYRSTSRGKAVVMDLRMRKDIHLVSGDNTLEITATNQRGRRFYRNWILRTRTQARNEFFAYDSSISPNDENGSPPEVNLAEPEFPIVLGKGALRVRFRGTVSAGAPIAQVTVAGSAIPAVSGLDAPFDTTVLVSARDSVVAVEAVDQNGNRTRVGVPVAQAHPAKPPRLTGDRYALIVGVARHASPSAAPPDNPGASADATALADALVAHAAFPRDHVLVLCDERAQSAQIRNGLRNFAARPRPDDLLLIYFASRGFHDPSSPDKIYLDSWDAQWTTLSETAIDAAELDALLTTNVRSKHTVLMLDVSRTSDAGEGISGSNLAAAALMHQLSRDPSRTIMVSTSLRQVSMQSSADGQGVFTSWIVRAFSGAGDVDHDGILTVGELFRAVSDGVRRETDGGQIPVFHLADASFPVTSSGQ